MQSNFNHKLINKIMISNDDKLKGFYDASEDKYNQRHLSDTRKPKLTLKHLNRLKKMRALKQLETLKRQDILGIMYAPPAEEDSGGMGGF